MRPRFALLVALLLTAAAVVPVTGSTPAPERSQSTEWTVESITTVNNTTNQLGIPNSEVNRSTYSDAGIDVGTSVQTGSTQLHHRHESLAFEQRFEATETDAARSELISRYLSTIERQQTMLDSRQDTAMRQFAAGEMSAATFLRTRMVVNAEAAELLETLNRIDTVQDDAAGYSLTTDQTTRIRTIEGELSTLTGPVGDQLHGDAANANGQNAVYLEVSENGYMLASVDDDTYIRETRLDDERAPTQPDQFLADAQESGGSRFSEADERASEIYTWLYERQRPSFTYYGDSGIYELTATHPNGQLVAYIDGGTTNVFYEQQTRDLSGVETTRLTTAGNETLRVTLYRSVETGPLLVSATDNTTGEDVDADIAIDGQHVGSTGSDGRLWAVEPSDDYTVNATRADTETVINVSAA
jgi:hypothetical protein